MKTLAVINEQHKLSSEQEQLLNERFENWEFLKVPASGWSVEDIKEVSSKLKISHGIESVVFVTPVPALIANLSFGAGFDHGYAYNPNANHVGDTPIIFIFHNDILINPFNLSVLCN